jgi:transcriptional regulator GlxA family with amidase domain
VAFLLGLDFRQKDINYHKMDQATPSAIYRVGVVLTEGFALMSYASVIEPMRAANLLSDACVFDVEHLHPNGGLIGSSGSTQVQTSCDTSTEFDLVLVMAGGDPSIAETPAMFRFLRRIARTSKAIGGVSGGPMLLAAAGLMAGRRMTVHWEHAPAMVERWPDLLLERSLYVIDRDRMTCAGGTAALDMMYALIAEQVDATLARRTSDWLLHTDVRPSIGPQRASLVERVGTNDATLLAVVEVMENRIADPLPLTRLAEIGHVGRRQINRLFRQKLGASTMTYYRNMRLDVAQNLLRNSSLSITEIALATGFGSSAHFATAYVARFDEVPSSLRR